MKNITLTIKDNQVELPVRELHGQRVVTLKDIDMIHGRPEGTALRNFMKNKHRIIEKEDYFELNQPDEIRRVGIERPQGGTYEKIYLLTESGYLMLVKSFNDDLAWEVQRQLVRGYFRSRQSSILNLLAQHYGPEEAQRLEKLQMESLQVKDGFPYHDETMVVPDELKKVFGVNYGVIQWRLYEVGILKEEYIQVNSKRASRVFLLTDKGREVGEQLEKPIKKYAIYALPQRYKIEAVLPVIKFDIMGRDEKTQEIYRLWCEKYL